MKVLVAEDDPLVGDAFSEALRARYHTVFRAATEDTVNRLSDGEIDVGILDV
ncbi:MAG: response regulator transcription factor, partial [Acidimicrobiia bacterium]|nr:response regulator transcription factor [Acidimicrobiia bacterium]